MKKAVDNFTVIENTALNASNFLIRLKSPVSLQELVPGQFVNIEINNTDQVFLRRPFSIFEINYEEQTLSLIVKILGKGSKILSKIKPLETLSLVYPLGKGFTKPNINDKILCIGGGSGVAPMLFLAKTSGLPKENIHIILGARSKEDVINIEEYNNFGQVHFTTEDGSVGKKGRVTDHPLFAEELISFNKVYSCGPEPMMKAIATKAKEKKVFCEVSLENLMACGFGVCLCCIEPTDEGNLCVCTEGPVFNINSLKW
ncbi:MAG: dihydroorotate dehydrogenase electron transfer subunit [Mariniphaga sp.]|nr:dihydroorotate dehydrogenase electron transfer subunit [Mariniphaga sp.]